MSAVIKSSSKFSTRTSTKTFKSFGVEENEWSGSEEEAWRYTSGAYYTKDLSDDEQEEGGGGGGGSAGGDQSSAGQTITDSNPSVQGPLIDNFYSKREHNRSKFVSGQAKLKMTYLAKEEKQIILASKRGFHIPVPILSSLTLEHMGEELVEFMWRQFLDHDTDESELVMVNKLPIIFHQIRTHFGYKIKVEELGLKALEDDDYIGFVEVCEAMTNVMPSIRPYVEIAEPKEARLHCCSHVACKHVNDETDQDEEEHEIDIAKKVKGGNYQLFVVFNQWVSDLNGKIRNKHVTSIMEDALIPYDVNRLPPSFCTYLADLLVPTYPDLEVLVEALRTDKDELRLQRTTEKLFMLPLWLKGAFTPAEIVLFKHYYLSIPENAHEAKADADDEGNIIVMDQKADDMSYKTLPSVSTKRPTTSSVAELKNQLSKDSDRFQTILSHMGASISSKQSEKLLRLHCRKVRGDVRFDFLAFVVILYKVSKGTIRCKAIKNALRDLRANVQIFAEIEELHRMPVPGVTIVDYGGSPIVIEFLLRGPEDSLYAGGSYRLKITLPMEGYPYRCPKVLFVTRMLSINILNRFDGSGTLPHLEGMWDAGWTIRKILEHVITLLMSPDLSYVPKHLLHLAVSWVYNRAKEDEYPDEVDAWRIATKEVLKKVVLEEEEETTLLAEAATKWKQEAIFSKPDSSKPNPRVPSKSPSSMDSPYNTTGNDDLSGVIKQLQKHIDNTSNHQTTTALTSRFADVNNMENPRPSNYEHLRNILPENFPLEGIVRDRITSFAQVEKSIQAMTKIEQLHVNFVASLLDDTERYIGAVQAIVTRFSEPNLPSSEHGYELSHHQSEEKQEYGDEMMLPEGNGTMGEHLRDGDLTCENSLDPRDSARYYEDHYYGYDPASLGAEKTTNEYGSAMENDFILDLDHEHDENFHPSTSQPVSSGNTLHR